jgi:hypothetical protein
MKAKAPAIHHLATYRFRNIGALSWQLEVTCRRFNNR